MSGMKSFWKDLSVMLHIIDKAGFRAIKQFVVGEASSST